MNILPTTNSTPECKYAAQVEWMLSVMYHSEATAAPRLGGTNPNPTSPPFKFSEQTFTEAIIGFTSLQFSGVISQAFTSSREASVSGADWLCHIKTKTLTALLLIQAKRPVAAFHTKPLLSFDMDSKPRRATINNPPRPQWYQRDTLIKHAQSLGAIPLYGFYAPRCSHSQCASAPWQCPSNPRNAYGFFHLVSANLVTQDPYKVRGAFPGTTFSSMLCCASIVRQLGLDFGLQEPVGQEHILSIVRQLSETGEAPKIISFLDFTARD